MIGIVGFMSGGKTYTGVELSLGWLKFQHRLVTNVRLNCRGVTSYLDVPCVLWKQYYYLLVDDESEFQYHAIKIDDYEKWPCGSPRGSATYDKDKVYIVLDEVSSLFDSMTSSADGGIKAVATWARHSEKRGQMLYLIMQFPSELHKRLRNHITEYIECTNTNSVKLPLIGMGLPFFLQHMIIRRRLLPDLETVLGSAHWAPIDSRVYSCYNTGQIVVGHMQEIFAPVSAVADSSEQLFVEMLTRLGIVLSFFWFVAIVFFIWRFLNGTQNF